MRSLAMLLGAAVLATAAAAQAAPTPPLSKQRTWVTDADGRAVILHGVNMVYKRPPYDPAVTGFGEDDAAFLARHGFNNVRLGTIYTAVEPRPGAYDDAYLARIDHLERILARRGIFTMIDFHQDLYNERYGGEGFPDWAVLDDGAPAEPKPGFPITYATSPGLNAAFNSLWTNRAGPGGVGLMDRFAAAWRRVAKRFAGRPYVMGYDLINEPWPGQQRIVTCGIGGCPAFEGGPLAQLQGKAMRAIREVDRTSLLWYEPNVLSQFGGAEYAIPNPTGDPRAGMSFHIYCLTGAVPILNGSCENLEQASLERALERARTNGDPALLSEFGATADLAVVRRMVDRADRGMTGWQWWHYCGCSDPTTAGPGDAQAIVSDPAKAPVGANVLEGKLRALVRPYPRAVAGTPQAYFFDRETRTFNLRYSTVRPDARGSFAARSTTEVFVPRLQYPEGYGVVVSGATLASPARSRVVRVRSAPGAKEVRVRISPGAGAFPRVRVPLRARTTPRRDRRAAFRFVTRGRIDLPEGTDPEDGCKGSVRVTLRRAGRRVSRRRARLSPDCRFRSAAKVRRRGRLRVRARFGGNELLLPARTPARRLRAG